MRKFIVVALAVLAIFGMLAPPVSAQAPAPKVTISGLLDVVNGWNQNVSYSDNSIINQHDREWYTRQRFRPDFIFELGKAKAVWGVELDVAWGQASYSDSSVAGSAFGSSSKTGTTANFDINTDTQIGVETKWLYLEFPVPWIPMANTLTLGAQDFRATYKPGIYATGDFPGVNWVINWAPGIRSHFTYVQIEDHVNSAPQGGTVSALNRGDDFGIILSVEVSPMKGLDLRPIYAYLRLDGCTNGGPRANTSGLSNCGPNTYLQSGNNNDIFPTTSRATFRPDDTENRHTIGIDARWKAGPLSIDPTFMYQWGTRETSAQTAAVDVFPKQADISAWLADVRVGYQLGPLNLGLLGAWSTGNHARVNPRSAISYYSPLSTDTLYQVGWSSLLTPGVDYLTQMHTGAAPGNPLSMGSTIGYDKYGRRSVAARAIYDVTPAFSVRLVGRADWTDQAVDTNTTTANLGNPTVTPSGIGVNGTKWFLGHEYDVGFTYKFAPGLTLDWEYAVMFTGAARDVAPATPNDVNPKNSMDAENVYYSGLRIRYQF